MITPGKTNTPHPFAGGKTEARLRLWLLHLSPRGDLAPSHPTSRHLLVHHDVDDGVVDGGRLGKAGMVMKMGPKSGPDG